MTIKVLIIDDDPAFRALFRHHITTEWPDAAITEYDPLSTGNLAPCGLNVVVPVSGVIGRRVLRIVSMFRHDSSRSI